MTERQNHPDAINADYLVDENGAHINVPDDEKAVNATHDEPTVGATGPTSWWRTGLLVLAGLIALVMILQLATGGSVSPTQAPDPNAQFEAPTTETAPNPQQAAPAPTDAAPADQSAQPAQ